MAVVLWTVTVQAQESDVTVSTQKILHKLQLQSQQSEKQLNEVLATEDTSAVTSMDVILSRGKIGLRSTTRDLSAMATPAMTRINMELRPDATLRVIDNNDLPGLVLTGKWIIDYARMIKLVPEYEKTLASYKSQTEIQQQLVTELEGVIGVKDKKIDILNEIAGAHEKRGNLYKTMAEIESDPWYEKVFRKMAFPLGLTVGAYLGIKIADNN